VLCGVSWGGKLAAQQIRKRLSRSRYMDSEYALYDVL